MFVGAPDHVFLQTTQQRGKSCASPKRNDSETANGNLRFGGVLFHAYIQNF
jgi:hypothetical protein